MSISLEENIKMLECYRIIRNYNNNSNMTSDIFENFNRTMLIFDNSHSPTHAMHRYLGYSINIGKSLNDVIDGINGMIDRTINIIKKLSVQPDLKYMNFSMEYDGTILMEFVNKKKNNLTLSILNDFEAFKIFKMQYDPNDSNYVIGIFGFKRKEKNRKVLSIANILCDRYDTEESLKLTADDINGYLDKFYNL
jgi:hypothetical protein